MRHNSLVFFLLSSHQTADDSDHPEHEDNAVDDHHGHHQFPGASLAEVRVGAPFSQHGSRRARLDARPVLNHLDNKGVTNLSRNLKLFWIIKLSQL